MAIYTLYSIVVLGTNPVASPFIKKELCEMIGDKTKTIDYLYLTLNGISATDDSIADEILRNESTIDDGDIIGEC